MGKGHRPVRRSARAPQTFTVRFTADFTTDVESQIAWVSAHHGRLWVERLEVELSDARELLGRLPLAGQADLQRPGLRRLILRRLPFVIWYGMKPRKTVVLFRLFHVRQRRAY